MSRTVFDDAACLSCDPFEGDFGGCGADDGILKDRIVRAAKLHDCKCHLCAGSIQKGERHRYRVEVYDGEMMTFRWCAECCQAMAISGADGGEAFEAREDIGFGLRAASGGDGGKG